MPPFSLDLRDAVMVITGIVSVTGVILAQRHGITKLSEGQTALEMKLREGQTEMLRQLGALHKRLDGYGARIGKAEINHAVLLERVENIRDTQRMRRARLEATESGEPPMFVEDSEG